MAEATLHWSVESCSYFRGHLYLSGWAFHPTTKVTSLAVLLPDGTKLKVPGYGEKSPDVADVHGDAARACRFKAQLPVPSASEAQGAKLHFTLRGAEAVTVSDLAQRLRGEPFHHLFPRFQELVLERAEPSVIEIGSRARSGNVNRGWLPAEATYVGFDIAAGPNVDVVGDAHELDRYFEPGSTDAVFSISTIEHLAMPWKAAVAINRVLRQGGLVFAASHQTWPLHDEPWDFWRFSASAWHALFNAATGFEVVDIALGERAAIVAELFTAATAALDAQPAYLGSSVIARKVTTTDLKWDVPTSLVVPSAYPA